MKPCFTLRKLVLYSTQQFLNNTLTKTQRNNTRCNTQQKINSYEKCMAYMCFSKCESVFICMPLEIAKSTEVQIRSQDDK